MAKRCYEDHPPLPIGEFKIYGGSCGHPVVKDADIYVGFDMSMAITEMKYPWVPGESFYFPIADQCAPKNPVLFAQLIDWLALQLTATKKIHLGCIGGHGRTGTVLAALVAKMLPDEPDAIGYVRKHYCSKAVESQAQIDFLVKHFKVATAEPRKMSWSTPPKVSKGTSVNGNGQVDTTYAFSPKPPAAIKGAGFHVLPGDVGKGSPTPSSSAVWGVTVRFYK